MKWASRAFLIFILDDYQYKIKKLEVILLYFIFVFYYHEFMNINERTPQEIERIKESIKQLTYTKELDMYVTDIKYDTVISNDSLSYFFKIQDEREEGIKEGIKEESFNTARRMKKANCESSFIMDMTGLTKEEIEAL